MGKTSPLKLSKTRVGSATVLHVGGTLDETFDPAMISDLSGCVLIDFDQITRVTSFGVRGWTRAMRQLAVDYLAFINVRPVALTHFNIVAGFGGRGEILSFHAPYRCQTCNGEAELLIETRDQYEALVRGVLPVVPCAACGSQSEVDEYAPQYLAAVVNQPRPAPPTSAVDALAELARGKQDGQ
jgi:hypothetical protein